MSPTIGRAGTVPVGAEALNFPVSGPRDRPLRPVGHQYPLGIVNVRHAGLRHRDRQAPDRRRTGRDARLGGARRQAPRPSGAVT